MDKIPISKDLKRILPNRYSPVSIVDDEGNILGTYVPRLTMDDMEPDGGWPSQAEIEALAKAHGPRYTTAQVIAHLRSLG